MSMLYPVQRFIEFLHSGVISKRTYALLGLFVLALVVPFTVGVLQQRTEIRQHAAAPTNGTTAASGNCLSQGYNPGDKYYQCTGATMTCASDAGVGVPFVCNPDGNWSNANPSGECTTLCVQNITCVGSLSFQCGTTSANSLSATWNATSATGNSTDCNVFIRGGSTDYTISHNCGGTWNGTSLPGNVAITNNGIYDLYVSNGNTAGTCYNQQKGHVQLACNAPTPSISPVASPTQAACPANAQFLSPDLGAACTACIIGAAPTLRTDILAANASFSVCSDQQLVNYWCNGGLGAQGTADCNLKKTNNCSAQCAGGTTGVQLTVNLTLSGIGVNANTSPKTPTRQVSVELYDSNDQIVGTAHAGSVTYSNNTFNGVINLGQVAPGTYSVKVKSSKYLKKRAPGFIRVVAGTNAYTLPATTLSAGDINDDGVADIRDYNILINCFGPKADTAACGSDKVKSDLDDNGTVDGVDYNVFIRSFVDQSGD